MVGRVVSLQTIVRVFATLQHISCIGGKPRARSTAVSHATPGTITTHAIDGNGPPPHKPPAMPTTAQSLALPPRPPATAIAGTRALVLPPPTEAGGVAQARQCLGPTSRAQPPPLRG